MLNAHFLSGGASSIRDDPFGELDHKDVRTAEKAAWELGLSFQSTYFPLCFLSFVVRCAATCAVYFRDFVRFLIFLINFILG